MGYVNAKSASEIGRVNDTLFGKEKEFFGAVTLVLTTKALSDTFPSKIEPVLEKCWMTYIQKLTFKSFKFKVLTRALFFEPILRLFYWCNLRMGLIS